MNDAPNVLWLTLESVRADHTSPYGYQRETTPNLAAIGRRKDAAVLPNPVSQSIWTPPSTASMLTGTYMSTHGVGQKWKEELKLRPDVRTLPEELRDEGYDTALFSSNPYVNSTLGFDRGFEHFDFVSPSARGFIPADRDALDHWACAARKLASYLGDPDPTKMANEIRFGATCVLARRIQRWLSSGRDDEEPPFFAYSHLQSPHYPYFPTAQFRDTFIDEIEMSTDEAYSLVKDVYIGVDNIASRIAHGLAFSDAEWAGIQAMYDAEIRYVDEIIGQIVQTAEIATDRRLIVIITGDHGELFGEHGLIGHSLVTHDALIKVPAIVVGIDGIDLGDDDISQHIDITKTVAEVIGVTTDEFEGRDLRQRPLEFGISQRGTTPLDRYTKHNPEYDIEQFFSDPFTCVRTSEYKYIGNESREELYHLPNETENIIDEEQGKATELSDVITTENITWEWSSERDSAEFDEEVRERLQDFGYL